ncbi:MAG: glycosyltransferase, partial [Bacteroidota bacterium]|nr:glycosyltransferase [Bacteroidota bacterium]
GFLHQSFQNTDYYPNWVNKLNVRWLYRIYNEPKLIKRYTIDYSWFLVVFMYDWIKYTISK